MTEKRLNTLLQIPDNAKVTNTKTSVYWFGDDGILYSINRKSSPVSLEEAKTTMEDFLKMAQGRKFCMLGDVTHSQPSSREIREYAAQEFPKVVKAMAMVSASPVGRTLGRLFLKLVPQPYPAKMFNTVDEAKDWLRQYL